jgi:arabinofuranosyltransferase
MTDGMTPSELRRERIGLALLLLCFFFLAFLTYSHLGEDAFISFRYARNLAHGRGLVYNTGEWVEGYSNLLWVLVLAPFEWIGVRLHVAARILSTCAFAGAIVISWWAASRLASDEDTPGWIRWWLPVAVALEPYLHYHDDRGLETVPYAALLAGALLVLCAGGRAWVAGLLGALAALTRPEGIGFVVAIAPVALLNSPGVYTERPEERGGFRRVAVYLAPAIAAFVGQLAFRRVAYGEWVPNTMIAKRAAGGGLGEVAALVCSHALLPVIAVAGCICGLWNARLRPLATGCLLTLLAAAAFQVRAGSLLNEGFRYLVPAMIPTVIGCWLLVYTIGPRKRGWAVCLALLGLVPVTLFGEGDSWRLFRGNGDAPRSRLLVRLAERETWDLADRWRWYFHDPIFINAEAGRWTRGNLPPDALLAGDQMGQFGFYAHEDQRIIDLIGLMDRTVARSGLTVEYLAQRSPDYLVVQTNDGSAYWPREQRRAPSVPQIAEVFRSGEFRRLYRPRWFLLSPVSIMKTGFMVYIRNDIDDRQPLEEVMLGVQDEEFERWWRVMWPRPSEVDDGGP